MLKKLVPKRWGLKTLLCCYIACMLIICFSIEAITSRKDGFAKMLWHAKDAEIFAHKCDECRFTPYDRGDSGMGGFYRCKRDDKNTIIIWDDSANSVKGRSGMIASRAWYYPIKTWIFIKEVLGIDLGGTK